MNKKALFSLVAIMLLFVVVLAGCSGNNAGNAPNPGANPPSSPSPATITEPDKPFEIVIARAYDIVGMDPCFLRESGQVIDNIFDRLIHRGLDMELTPGLATEWHMVDDLTWEFKLREGVKFHNGEDFNAEAVKYSIERVLDPANESPVLSYIKTVAGVDVIDQYTVQVRTNIPDPLIPSRFCRYPTEIVPPGYLKEAGPEKFAESPIGTGPYKFVEWVKDDRVVLVANEDYWGGVPEVSKVTWRSIPESSTRISALLAGEVDIAMAVPPEEISRVEGAAGARISTVERGGNIVYIGLKNAEEPFNNKLVRQALNYAVDVDSIVKNVLSNTTVATNSIIGPKDFGYAGEPSGYEYNPEKAKELLAEAGYPNGFSAELDAVNWYIRCNDVAQAIAAQLAKVGVTIKVNPVESTVYRSSVPSGQQSSMYFLGWSSTNTLDADASIYSVLHSSDPYSTYNNAEVDAMLEQARSSMDSNERIRLYKDIQEIVLEEAPRIFLYQENKYIGVSDKLDWNGRIDDALPVFTMKKAQ